MKSWNISEKEFLPKVIHQLGYPSEDVIGEDIRKEIDHAMARGREIARPKDLYKTTPVLKWGKGTLTGRDLLIKSTHWSRLMDHLDHPEIICCFVLTLGEEIDEEISRMQEKSIFKAYLLDAVASELAELMADKLEERVAAELKEQGYQATNRFSPGYCDWKLKPGQERIFQFLKPESIGVRCNSSGMMIPRKTVSGAIIGARGVKLQNPCSMCLREDCTYRRDPFTGKSNIP